jgi:hypothetical protein
MLVLALFGLGLFAYESGYQVGSDMARRDAATERLR